MGKKFTLDNIYNKLNFYNLTLLSDYKNVRTRITLKCHCGKIFTALPEDVLYRNRISCGCKRKIAGLYTKEDLSNTTVNNLSILERVIVNNRTKWKCVCKCGNFYIASHSRLKSGLAKSCGCLKSARGHLNSAWTGYQEISGEFWTRINKQAKERNLEFSVTIEQAWNQFLKQNRKCALSRLELLFGHNY